MAKKWTKQNIGMRGIKNGNKITYIKGVFLFLFEYTSVCMGASEWAGQWGVGMLLYKGCCGP